MYLSIFTSSFNDHVNCVLIDLLHTGENWFVTSSPTFRLMQFYNIFYFNNFTFFIKIEGFFGSTATE